MKINNKTKQDWDLFNPYPTYNYTNMPNNLDVSTLENPYIQVIWEDTPENFTQERIKSVKQYFMKKYSSTNINVITKVKTSDEDSMQTIDVSVNIMDKNYQTELVKTYLESKGQEQYFDQLMNIDLAVENEMGSALHLAAWMGRVDAMDALLAGGGLDPNLKGADGCTALIVAANSGRAESANRLLEIPGIDVNARDNAGDTALIAAAHRRPDIVRMLLARAEIDASASNKEGRTAMDVARDLGEPEIFRLIGAHLARREAIEIARSLGAPGLAEGPKPTPRAKKTRL